MSSKTVRKQTRRRAANKSEEQQVGQYFGDAWSLAKRTANGLNAIRKLINVETKLCRTASSHTVSTTGFIDPVSMLAQGTNYTDRVGDSIKLQTVELRFKLIMNVASNGTATRIILVRDMYQQGADPTMAQILQQTGALEAKNHLLRDRFSFLFDELIYTSNNGDDGCTYTVRIPHEGHIKYIGTTAASASNGFGSLYFVAISDEGTNLPTLAYNISVLFTDD